MPIATAARQLNAQARALGQAVSVTWKVAPAAPPDPVQAAIDPSWPEWRWGIWKNFQPNWIYADVALPESIAGVPLADSPVMLFIHGWLPFTLWVDGVELFKEEHPWKGTGPIAEPLPLPFTPGRPYRLVACITPTDAPPDQQFTVEFKSHGAMQLNTRLAAASGELRLGERLVKTDAERRKLARAAKRIDLDAIARQDYPRLLDSIAAFEQAVGWLSPRAKALVVHAVGHTHLDMDWMWTWEDTVRCIRRDFKAITDLMDDNAEVTFTHSQVPTYQVAEEEDPAVFAKVRQRIAEGRWENAAGTWVEGDLNMADGESIARHMLYAKQWTQAHLGNTARVLWEPDTFGHPGNMPQLARLGEIEAYYHWRCNPGRDRNWPVRTWEGIDGTRITAFSVPYGGGLHPDNVMGHCLLALDNGMKNALHVWGLGDHGGGIQRWMLDLLRLFRDSPLFPTIRFSTIAGLLAAIKTERPNLPSNRGEEPTLFPGCFTTHARTKQLNRQCEGALLTAEALCALGGLERRDALREAWTPVLFNHFHDIFDGAAVHASDLAAQARFARSLAAAGAIADEALAALVRPSPDGKTLTVVNPLGFERSEAVRARLPAGTACLIDSDGEAVAVQPSGDEYVFFADKVPAFGSRVYRVSPKLPRGAIFPDAAVEDIELSSWDRHRNNTFRIDLAHACCHLSKSTGAVNSYFDKKLNRELVPRGLPLALEHTYCSRQDNALGVFQIIDESHNAMNAWLIHDVLREENLLQPVKVEKVACGPVFARFRVEHRFRKSTIEEFITFYKNMPRVDFEAMIDWRERGSEQAGVPQLKVSFGTGLAASQARFEGPFTVVERPANGMEQPTQKFVDVPADGAGYTLYNDSKYGCDVRGGRARITLLRNTYFPDTESDNGVHRVKFAFDPHDGARSAAECVRRGMAFNRPLLTALTSTPPARSKPMLRIEGSESIVCTGLRQAEASDRLLIRLFAAGSKRCKATLSMGRAIKEVEEVNFLEHPVGKAALRAGKVQIGMRPFEVKTLAVTLGK